VARGERPLAPSLGAVVSAPVLTGALAGSGRPGGGSVACLIHEPGSGHPHAVTA
jgi:hypothetical protein